jgi:DNA-binding transcriptional regulator LsrR (DeoR family)
MIIRNKYPNPAHQEADELALKAYEMKKNERLTNIEIGERLGVSKNYVGNLINIGKRINRNRTGG